MTTDKDQTSARLHPRADHVGSLLRPAAMLADIERETGATLDEVSATNNSLSFAGADQEAILAITRDHIREAVRRQEATGIGTVTDGEFRRGFFMGSLDQAIKGFAPSDETIEFHNDEETVAVEQRPIVTSRLEVVAHPGADEARLVREFTDAPVKVTFPGASSLANPRMFKPGVTDRHYSDFQEMAADLRRIQREQVAAAIDAGANYIQFDMPAYPVLLDPAFEDRFGKGFRDVALEAAIAADTEMVSDIPDHVTTGLHLCRGNLRGMWMVDAKLDPIADRLFALPYDNFLVEWDDTDRMGDYSALQGVPKGGPIVVMGLISTKGGELEDEDEIMRRIEEAARYVDLDQLALSPQCGFASEIAGNELSEDEQWAKLELVVRLAERIWG